MKLSRTMLGGLVAAVGLVVVVAAGGLVVGGAPHQGATTLSVAKPPPPPPPSVGCALVFVQATDYWVCAGSGVKGQPPPSPSLGCSIGVVIAGENSEICKGQVSAHAPVTKGWVSGSWEWAHARPALAGHWMWVPGYLAPATPIAKVAANSTSSGSSADQAGTLSYATPSPTPWPWHPFLIPPAKPWLAGQPAPKPTPILLMQVSASLATAPASPTAIVLLTDWPAAGPGTVTISVYPGSNVDACSSPPRVTKTADAGWGGVPSEWSATFSGLVVGSYEVQAAFVGKAGPMSTPCGRDALKVLAAPGNGQ